MFDWLLKRKKPQQAPQKARAGRKKPASARVARPATQHSGHSGYEASEAGETGGLKEIVQPGKLLLRQQVVTEAGTQKFYVQPVKLEIPNMVTIGGKLDLILDELEKKPDREWFQTDYIETLKSVLALTSDAGTAETRAGPDAQRMAQTLSLINREVSSALIIETLRVKGPLNITELSKHTGVSRVTVWREIKKLSEEGKIKIKREGRFKVAALK